MADSGTDLAHLIVLALGSVCVLLGFLLVARGIGSSESESSVKFVGVEIKLARVGPGILFALIGVLLVYFGLAPGPARPEPEVKADTRAAPDAAPTPLPQPAARAEPAARPVPARSEETSAPRSTVNRGVVLTPPGELFGPSRSVEIAALRSAIEAQAQGRCPEELFASALREACERQLDWAPASLAAKGAIGTITYDGKAFPGSTVNAYKVRFEHAEMRWLISLGPDGKLVLVSSSS